jgi:hypothetical protein
MTNPMPKPERVETEVATIEQIQRDLVTVRLKPGVSVSSPTVLDILAARKAHFGGSAHHVLMIAPADMEFDLQVMYNDHCGEVGMDGLTKSVTWVANSEVNMHLLNLYYAYFPSKVPLNIVHEEPEARAHLAKLIAGVSAN